MQKMNTIEKSINKTSDKLFLRSLILNGSERIDLNELKGSAQSLQHYKRVTLDGYLTEFVCCNRCQCIVQYISRVGTSGLNRHLNYCNNKAIKLLTKRKSNQEQQQDQDIRKVGQKEPVISQSTSGQIFCVNNSSIYIKSEPISSETDDHFNQSYVNQNRNNQKKKRRISYSKNNEVSNEVINCSPDVNALFIIDSDYCESVSNELEEENYDFSVNGVEKCFLKTVDKQVLRTLISRNSDRIELIELNGNSKSLQFYKRIILDNELTEFVCCNHCNVVVKYVPKVGTSGLNRHLVNCNNSNSNSNSNDKSSQVFVSNSLSNDKKIQIPSHVKKEITQHLVKFCALDSTPIGFMEGNNFRSFCNKLIQIGSTYGSIDINDVLTNTTKKSKLNLKFIKNVTKTD